MRIRILLGHGVAALMLFILLAIPAAAESVTVQLDQATVLPISLPAATVIIGNPAIADATILDSQTLLITGHSYGTTNLLVFDADGQRVAQELVTVIAPSNGLVTVHRRVSRQTYSCWPNCSPVIAIGDAADQFKSIDSQVQSRRDLANNAGKGPAN